MFAKIKCRSLIIEAVENGWAGLEHFFYGKDHAHFFFDVYKIVIFEIIMEISV